jgi:hypothetical protein
MYYEKVLRLRTSSRIHEPAHARTHALISSIDVASAASKASERRL